MRNNKWWWILVVVILVFSLVSNNALASPTAPQPEYPTATPFKIEQSNTARIVNSISADGYPHTPKNPPIWDIETPIGYLIEYSDGGISAHLDLGFLQFSWSWFAPSDTSEGFSVGWGGFVRQLDILNRRISLRHFLSK